MAQHEWYQKNTLKFLLIGLIFFCLVQAVGAATIVAAKDSSSTWKAQAKYICDGVNDQVEINAALSALPSGGTVILASGKFNLASPVRPKSHTTLEGQGKDATILNFVSEDSVSLGNSGYITISDFQITGKGRVYITSSHNVLTNIKVYNVDNSKASAFHIYAYYTVVQDVEFNGCEAIDVDRSGFLHTGTGSTSKTSNIRYNNCRAINCGRYGQYYGENHEYPDAWCTGFVPVENIDGENIIYTNCEASGSWENGFHCEPPRNGGDAINIQYINCIARNNGQKELTNSAYAPCSWGGGFVVVKGNYLKNCVAENNLVGYYVNNQGAELVGCIDRGSRTGYLLLLISEGVKMTGCSAIGSTQPVNIWTGSTKNIVIDDIEISSSTAKSTPGILISSTAATPSGVLVKNSVIKGYKYGVQNKASSKGLTQVYNVAVQDATTDFIGCKILSQSTASTSTSTTTQTTTPALTTTSPNGGESWARGTTPHITWTSSGSVGSYVKIELLKAGVVNKVITSSTANDGSYSSWAIPTTQTTGSDYKIRITSTSNSAYADSSNAYFSITSGSTTTATGLITVTDPNGGESYARGTTQRITWTSSGSVGSNVKIELLKAGVVNRIITSSTANDGSYSYWDISSSQTTGSDYKIRISSTTNGACTDSSGANFAIR
ncbi:MAG: GPI anchored serine-threonine rich family protein [Methanomicrobiales archaeon]|nr:GPI anchored serine-threonine rich family protein [Methanomicrobiales archaeon]